MGEATSLACAAQVGPDGRHGGIHPLRLPCQLWIRQLQHDSSGRLQCFSRSMQARQQSVRQTTLPHTCPGRQALMQQRLQQRLRRGDVSSRLQYTMQMLRPWWELAQS